ncbi:MULTISPECIES: transaldolase [Prochlorococcus]|mgnify:FL=1|uniref:transaldolase n=1 Tax=Prochlorococcus TaxID=1218 RepID=UPI0007B3E007|nr:MULTISPECIES: transaldolase [Prochlorococcus]KZR62658.1 Transaldolase [Prochlorococcus marinus str. MIT 1312]KZR74849.1 Transaldolase [Prochlorococcus marinus str. MIT 1320]KZR80861.1 Transaldolase [Prochlorococcus marinus str. MIT 1327]NMO85275.1 transaldolase [Prochlorococcus sp. P1344]NMP06991.1 transaldolase [Prochlorococcus sp. P1361]|tara:strand:- start:27 stop:1199 length:1173 start_codon:yes stop_codon:yes gene_type:complete
MATLLEQLSTMTVVVADTGDLDAIRKFTPRDATTNPSLILAAAQIPAYQSLIDEALHSSRQLLGNSAAVEEVVHEALDEICVIFGKEILKIVPGRVSTEVDARLSFNTEATIAKAHKLIGLYNDAGITNDRVLIKIASTWEGIKAAEVLEKDGIHCNLTLLFGFSQAVACAEAGVTLISPFVGRILDWYKASTGRDSYAGPEDPGVISVTKIFNYFKTYDYKTEIMGASFRNLDEIIELAGCDLLTISPKLLDQLGSTEAPLMRKLDAVNPVAAESQIHVDKESFESMMRADRMAFEKLDEGIRGFSKAIETLEAQLAHRLAVLEGGAAFCHVVQEIFMLNDLDGDGCITREEWLGSDAVFDALDHDHDGRLLQEDVRSGLGAALALTTA